MFFDVVFITWLVFLAMSDIQWNKSGLRRMNDMKNTELKLISEVMKNCRRSDRELAKSLGISQPKVDYGLAALFKESVGARSGFGLFLIKRMTEVYSWKIQETGKRGKGTQFTITIL